MLPGTQQRLLDQILGALTVAAGEAQRMREQRVTVFLV
jgi:hypothetical protein